MLNKFLKFLGAVDGEERQMWFLLGVGAFMGFFLASYQVGTESLFIQSLGEEYLAESFFITGALGIISSVAYVYLQKKIRFSQLVIGNAAVITLFVCGLRIAFEFVEVGDKESGFSLLPFLLFVMMGPMTSILLLGFWGLFGRIFDTRQTKRLIGSVDTGQLVATIVAFFSIPLLIELPFVDDTYDLLLISCFAMIVILWLTILICKNYNVDLIDSLKKDQKIENTSYLGIFKNHYTRLLSIFIVCSMGTAIFVEYSFLATIEIYHPEEDKLNRFLSFFNGTVIIMSFIIQTFINDIILNRFGLKVALMTMPIILILFMIGGLISGHFFGYEVLNEDFLFFFMFIISGKAFTASLRDALESPAFKLFFLPFNLTVRFDIQNKIEGVIGQLATFLAGGLQILVASLVFMKLIHFIYLIIAIALGVIYLSVKLYNQYQIKLKETLVNQRDLIADKGKTNEFSALRVLNNELKSENEIRVLNALRLYEQLDPIKLTRVLLDQLSSYSVEVRSYAYSKLSEIKAYETLEIIKQESKKEQNESVLILARKAIKVLQKFQAYELNDESIRRYTRSTIPQDRVHGARLLVKLEEDKHLPYLAELLRDINPEVRIAALLSIGKLQRPEMFAVILDHLHIPTYSNAAMSALMYLGDRVFHSADAAFFKTGQHTATMVRVVQLFGIIGGKQAKELLWKKIEFPNKQVVSELLKSLNSLGFESKDFQSARIKLIIENLICDIAWNIKAIQDIPQVDPIDPLDVELLKALREENIVNLNNLFILLGMIYDIHNVQLVKENLTLGSMDSVTFAIEMLDVFVEDEIKPMLLPVLDDITDKERLELLLNFFPPEQFESYSDLLTQIVNRDFNRITRYTKSLAMNRLHQLPDARVSNSLIANLFNPDILLLQSAANSIYQMEPEAYQTHTKRIKSYSKKRLDEIILPPVFAYKEEENYRKMLLVDRVRFIKSIPSFATIPGDSITRIVDTMNQKKVDKGTILINEGDSVEQPLFVIIDGKIDLIRSGVVFKSLGPKDIMGEEVILFSEKYDFKAVAKEETSFFILPKEEIFDLMTLHSEILKAFLDLIDKSVKSDSIDPYDLSILDENVSVFN